MPSFFETTIFGISFSATYYGLAYALGFIVGNYIIYRRNVIPRKLIDDLFFYMFLGLFIGARMGYVLFYNYSHYLQNPLDVFKIWEGGMSFHGGVIGVIIAMIIFSRKFKFNFYALADQITLVVPIGLGLGRFGNYINKELVGYSDYNGPFAIVKNGESYFPSPLLECLLEGVVLFLILNIIYRKAKNIKPGQIAALFLVFYAIFRILVEIFFRQPDTNIGYIFGHFTMGELLSLPMLVIGIFYYFRLRNNA